MTEPTLRTMARHHLQCCMRQQRHQHLIQRRAIVYIRIHAILNIVVDCRRLPYWHGEGMIGCDSSPAHWASMPPLAHFHQQMTLLPAFMSRSLPRPPSESACLGLLPLLTRQTSAVYHHERPMPPTNTRSRGSFFRLPAANNQGVDSFGSEH